MYIAGATSPELEEAITQLLVADPKNREAKKESDKYDTMYDVTWRNTALTTGLATTVQKAFFPRAESACWRV